MNCIAYTTEDGGVAVIYPANTVAEAMKDVPDGADHAVLDAATLPTGDRDAWALQGGRIVIDPARKEAAKQAKRATVSCSRFQAFAALELAGKLDAAEAAVRQSDRMTQLAWDNAQEFRRLSPAINKLGKALGLDDEALDALFETATGIET
jgi:hypothetical protein